MLTPITPLKVREADGSPSVTWVREIVVSNGTLTDSGGGVVTLTTGGGGGTSDHVALSNLGWTASAHTGTASRIAGFDGSGNAAYYQIGVDVQAYDAELAAIAGLTSAADRVPYFTGSGTAALATFTSAGRALVDDADAAAQRTTLGLGALATLATVGTAQIDDAAVSYAKIQDVSTTQRTLGRNTSGAGDVEEVTASQLLDWVGSTRGSVLYRGASGWAALTPGTSGHYLQSQGAGADPQWAAASGGSGDLVSPLASAEISITTTATATVSRAHVCTGVSADYTVTLPAVAGNGGKLLYIRLASTMTKLVTLDAGGGKLVDDAQTLLLQAGESVLLVSDGNVRWNTVACRRIATQCQLVRASAQSGVLNDTRTKVLFDQAPFDKGGLADLANYRILIRRPGRYLVQASWGLVSSFDSGERVIAWVYKNATTDVSTAREIVNFILSPSASQSLIVVAQRVLDLVAGDYLLMWIEQTSGGTISTSTEVSYRPTLTVTEVL